MADPIQDVTVRSDELASLIRVAELYLSALHADPAHEYLTGAEALLVTELRDVVAKYGAP